MMDKCGCFYKHNDKIVYCPTHKAAPALVTLVNAVEWVRDIEGNLYCPWCYALKKIGHFKDCKRQQALAQVKGKKGLIK